jgi:malate/lactate dehydrogenase
MDTTTSPANSTNEMVRWQLRLRNRLLTCGITKSGAAGYSVVTVPHFNVRKGTVEIYQDLVSALQRHASICSRLRAEGWSIASYTAS